MPAIDLDALLASAAPSERLLTELVGAILGAEGSVPNTVTVTRGEPIPYDFGSPATGALARLAGTADGAEWSVFVKVLQSPRHWRDIAKVPEPARSAFIAEFPWRTELGAWDPAFIERLPAGLRVPKLYRLSEVDTERIAVWMEDVDTDPRPWGPARFAQAARLLGEFAANSREPGLLAACGKPAGYGLHKYVDGPVRGAIAAIADDATWRHPALAEFAALQTDLLDLAGRVPALLDLADSTPQSLPHGDASPQNLLVPRAEPETFVAIDIAFQSPHAIGFDLAQLLIGLAHAGELPAAALPDLDAEMVESFLAGSGAGQRPADRRDIETGYFTTLALRSAFTSLPIRELDTANPALVAERCALTRFILHRTRNLAR
jgi:hypothetical protein